MAYKIVWTLKAEKTLAEVINYLDSKWSPSVADAFIDNVDMHLMLLESGVINGRNSSHAGVNSLLISKQIRLYYRKKANTIQLLLFYDTRQRPAKNPYER